MSEHDERARAVIDKVKAALAPIWLGGRQRMMLEQEIVTALREAEGRVWDDMKPLQIKYELVCGIIDSLKQKPCFACGYVEQRAQADKAK